MDSIARIPADRNWVVCTCDHLCLPIAAMTGIKVRSLNQSTPVDRPPAWVYALGLGSAVTGGWFAVLASTNTQVLTAATVLVGAFGLFYWWASRDVDEIELFHPVVVLTGYAIATHLAPIIAILVFNQTPLGMSEEGITFPLVAVMLVFVFGIWAGVAMPIPEVSPTDEVEASRVPVKQAHLVGVGLLWLSLGAQIFILWQTQDLSYGQNQSTYGLVDIFKILGRAGIIAGTMLAVRPTATSARELFSPQTWLLLASSSIVVVLIGTRNPLLAMVILVAWLYDSHVHKIGFRKALMLVAILIVVMGVLGVVRQSDTNRRELNPSNIQSVALTSITDPVYLTDIVMEETQESGFKKGDTYIESLKYLLPGPISRWLFGPPTGTTGTALRTELGLGNPDHGVGSAMVTEAFWNFGWAGAFMAPLLFGLFVRWSWAGRAGPYSIGRAVFPVVLCQIPFMMRTDMLAQIKLVLYPVTLISAGWLLCRSMDNGDSRS